MASTSNINNSKCAIGVQINQNQTVHNYNDNNQLEKMCRLPRLIDNFYGRQQEFEQLDRLFFSEMKLKVVIHGLPGYGKTEISKQYAKYCQDNKKVVKVFWFEMEDIKNLHDLSKDLQDIYEEYKDVRCMFIFDNSLNRQSIFHCEPVENQNHLLLINSHDADWGSDIVALPLGTLSPTAAVEVIRTILNANYREEDHGSYEALAEAVYCVPLGVQVAAAYVYKEMKCLKRRFDFAEYIQRIQRQDFINKKIPKNISNSYEKSIYSALAISLNKIKDQNDNESELALDILYFSAFLYPECINNDDLLKIQKIKTLVGNNSSESEIKFRCAVGLLINYSFVKYNEDNEDDEDSDINIKIHRLTQSCVRNYLRVHNLFDEYYYECLHAVFNVFDNIDHENSVLYHADDNTSVVCRFLKNHKKKVEDILEELVYRGCSECLKIILENHSREHDLEISPKVKNKLLMTAACIGQIKVIQVLVDCGADVNYQNSWNETPSFVFICHVCFKKSNICKQELYKMLELLNYKQHVQVIDTFYGRSSLHEAAGAANEYLITLLTNAGVCEIVNKQNKCGNTPLHTLVHFLNADSNKEEIVRIVAKLKACGAKLYIMNKDLETPLEMLLRLSKKEGYDCEYLIEHLTNTESAIEDLDDSFIWE